MKENPYIFMIMVHHSLKTKIKNDEKSETKLDHSIKHKKKRER